MWYCLETIILVGAYKVYFNGIDVVSLFDLPHHELLVGRLLQLTVHLHDQLDCVVQVLVVVRFLHGGVKSGGPDTTRIRR